MKNARDALRRKNRKMRASTTICAVNSAHKWKLRASRGFQQNTHRHIHRNKLSCTRFPLEIAFVSLSISEQLRRIHPPVSPSRKTVIT
jgi:hypothetical protein